MAHIEQIQAQHVQNYDVVVYDRLTKCEQKAYNKRIKASKLKSLQRKAFEV